MAAETIPAFIAWTTSPHELARQVRGMSPEAFAAALEAVELVEVDYQPLDAVVDPLAAMERAAPVIRSGSWRTWSIRSASRSTGCSSARRTGWSRSPC